jgi:hypothetical protein
MMSILVVAAGQSLKKRQLRGTDKCFKVTGLRMILSTVECGIGGMWAVVSREL